MKLSKIQSKFDLIELFSFLPQSIKFHIGKYNKFLNKKLNIINLLRKKLYKEKINYYEFTSIKNFLYLLKNDFNNEKIDENEIKDLLYYALSKKENFYLKLSDEYFPLLINSNYFNENINIEIENLTTEIIPKILLIKNNSLSNEALKVFKEIFDIFSINGKMNSTQINEFIINFFGNIEEKEIIFTLLSSYLSIDGFLKLEGFYKFYFDIINSNILEKVLNSDNNDEIKKGLDEV